MIHCSRGASTTIGNNVQIRAGAIVHGATVNDNCLIGEGMKFINNILF